MSTPVLSFRPESSGVKVDLERLVASRLLLQANSGGGKSYMLRYVLEQTHGRIQQIVLDPEGEFSTLREKFDYLLAGKEGDVPAEPKTAKVLARRLLELGASCVIDLYDLNLDDRRRFVRLFLEELMHLPRSLWHPALIVVDEAHVFAPEKGSAESLNAVITLCTQGRKRGFSALLATQRLSKLHKDAAAELLNKLIGRCGLDVDMARAGDELGFGKDTRLTLRDLEPGHFYAFGPAISKQVVQVKSGKVTTTHPEPGKIAPPAPPAPAAVKKLVVQLQDLAAQAKQEAITLEEKDRELAQLRREITTLRKTTKSGSVETVVDDKAIARAVAAAEKPLRDLVGRLEHERDTAVAQYDRALKRYNEELGKHFGKLQVLASQLLSGAENPPAPLTFAPSRTAVADLPKNIKPAPAPPARAASRVNANVNPDSKLGKGEAAVLTAICQYPDGATREQLTILTGYKRSSRDTYIQRLRGLGLVDARGDVIVPLDGAEEQLGDFEPLPTGAALRDYWLDRLSGGERAILQILIDAYPDAVDRDVITEQSDYKRSSRDTYIQRLRARQLVTIENGGVKASKILFEGR